jgi:hypothetical protein
MPSKKGGLPCCEAYSAAGWLTIIKEKSLAGSTLQGSFLFNMFYQKIKLSMPVIMASKQNLSRPAGRPLATYSLKFSGAVYLPY